MRFFLNKDLILNSIYSQITIIIFTFTLLCVSVIVFNCSVERKNTEENINNTFSLVETKITASFNGPEAFLTGYSESIQGMIVRGSPLHDSIELLETISLYMNDITYNLIHDEEITLNIISTYGYFYGWGGQFISGTGWMPPENYKPEDQSWFKEAAAANGKIAVSAPYTDERTRRIIISLSRYISDNDNNPLGVICVDMSLNSIYDSVVYINLTQNSYGFLINDKMQIFAHPVYYLSGDYLQIADNNIAAAANDFIYGNNTFRHNTKNYRNESSFVFFHKLRHGYVLGIVIPTAEYNLSVIYTVLFIILVSGIMATGLCIMMVQIARAKTKSDLRNKQKSNFLATMSHEIRTPLNAILGMTEIQMQLDTHPPSTIDAFGKINHSGNLLLNIINDILDLSKIEAGKLELVTARYEVASLINDVVQLNYIRYDSKPIEFIVDVDESIPSMLVGDELRIKQILNNLLSNAFKYTNNGEVKLKTNAEYVGKGGIVLVTLIFQIIDTGQGMTQEQINKMFDEYSRFNMEANRTTEGSGLGMTITQNLINLMQGRIFIKSALGAGTEVTVRIPQRTEGIGIRGVIGKELADNLRQFRKDNAIKVKRKQMSYEYMPYGNILIVDDVETNLYVAKGLMVPYGLKIDLATSGFEAIDKIKSGNIYDIIFMDHMMPKLDGIETTRIIRETGYKHPVVALTANALAGQAEVFMKNGFDGFISKPIDIRQLNVMLNKMIRGKQTTEVLAAAQKERAEYEKRHGPAMQQQIDPQLAGIFARDAKKAYTVLDTIIKNNVKTESELHLYIINVHAMKSALANIGENELSVIASKLEQAGRDKELNIILSETDAFLINLKAAIEKIKPKEDENEPSEDSNESLVYLQQKLAVIREACSSFDKKTVKNTLNELRDKTWSHKNRELLNIISEHLLHSEFDDIANLVYQIYKNYFDTAENEVN